MSLEALVLGLFSGLRPGTSLAAVLALLKTPRPQRLLLFFTAAGFASSWVIGLLVIGVFHGVDVAVGESTFTAVLDVAFGAAALGFAAGLQTRLGATRAQQITMPIDANPRRPLFSKTVIRPLRQGESPHPIDHDDAARGCH